MELLVCVVFAIALDRADNVLPTDDEVRIERMKSCGPNCLAELLRYYGYHATKTDVRSLIPLTDRGSSISSIVSASAKLGLPLDAIRVRPGQNYARYFPAIAYCEYGEGHFCVLFGYDPDARQYKLFDGNTISFLERISEEDFHRTWTGVLLVPARSFNFVEFVGVMIAAILISSIVVVSFRLRRSKVR
jgi:ABC-type bacteriocin/lantibiotic exporter with double-glycine peptidase domain